jgi:PPOX class probable F420-dependent enzyme
MAVQIPEAFRALFDDPRAFAHLATLMPSGAPQVTPVWIEFDGMYILINTAKGRQKDKNMRARNQVCIEILDPADPYRYLSVRGRVASITEEGADAHIDALAIKYTGKPFADRTPGQVRVIFKIEPQRIDAHHGVLLTG